MLNQADPVPTEVGQVSRNCYEFRRPGRALLQLSHESIGIGDRASVVDLRFRDRDADSGSPLSVVAECGNGGGTVVAELPAGVRAAWLQTPRSRFPLQRIGDRARADLPGPGPIRLELEIDDGQPQLSTQWVLVMAPPRSLPDTAVSADQRRAL